MKYKLQRSWLLALLMVASLAGPAFYGEISPFWEIPAVAYLIYTIYHNVKFYGKR